MHICLVEPVDVSRVKSRHATGENVTGELHNTHCAAHGSEMIGIKTEASERLFDDLKCKFSEVFAEPSHPIMKGYNAF